MTEAQQGVNGDDVSTPLAMKTHFHKGSSDSDLASTDLQIPGSEQDYLHNCHMEGVILLHTSNLRRGSFTGLTINITGKRIQASLVLYHYPTMFGDQSIDRSQVLSVP